MTREALGSFRALATIVDRLSVLARHSKFAAFHIQMVFRV